MNLREEFLHTVADGLVATEYTERFLQEMADHLDDAERLYALKENGSESEQNALRDIGDPKHSQKLFNHVMKYRNKISVLIEVLLLCVLELAISYTSELFTGFSYGGSTAGAVIALVGMAATIAFFVIIALRRIQAMTFGELRLIYPAAVFALAILVPSIMNWLFVIAMQVDAPTLSQVIEASGASAATKLIGVLIGYLLVQTAPWERLPQWKQLSEYRTKHSIGFNGWWLVSVYVVLSTVVIWLGERVYAWAYGPFLQLLFLVPRQAIEQLVFARVVIHSSILVYGTAAVLALTGMLLTYLIFSQKRKKQPVSPIQCAALIYIFCLLFGSPLLPPEPAEGMEWKVPVENIVQTQQRKQFWVLDRFASYLNSAHQPLVYAVRYRPTQKELQIATDHPHQIIAITGIQNVHTYSYAIADSQKRITDYSEDKTFPDGFSCDNVLPGGLAELHNGAYCSTVFYKDTMLLTIPRGGYAYVQHIATDETGRYALILMRNTVEHMANNQVYLVELPKTE